MEEFGGERRETVDLAVKNERIAGYAVDPRLMAARKIDNREPQMTKGDATFDVNAILIRSAMRDRRKHETQDRRVFRRGTSQVAGKTDDAAHGASFRRVSRR